MSQPDSAVATSSPGQPDLPVVDAVQAPAAAAAGVRRDTASPAAARRPTPVLAPFAVLPTPARPAAVAVGARWTGLIGLWRLADPKIAMASLAAVFLGSCLAAHDGVFEWRWLAATVAGIVCLEIAKNASGELFHFESGGDQAVGLEERSPFSGGQGVLRDRLLGRGQVQAVGAAALVLYCGIGLAIWQWREPGVLWLGVVGVALAFFYHAPPFKLAYRGLGELAVALAYGPGVVAGTYLVQRGSLAPAAVWLGIPLGLMVTAFLWINEIPDYRADRSAGKRNLVVALGRKRASRVFAVVVLLAQTGAGALPLVGLPETVLLGWASAVPAAIAAIILVANPDYTRRLIPAQALTMIAFLLFALAAGVGVLLAP